MRSSLAVPGAIAAAVLLASAAAAQQHVPAGGVAFSAEAGAQGTPSLFTVLSGGGALTGVSIRIVEGARVPSVRRPAGHRAGTLTFDGLAHPLALTIPARRSASGTLTLLHRGALRVTFAPRSRTVLSVTGLPGKTTGLELALAGGPGRLLTAQDCVDEQNFALTATRPGGRTPLHATAGVTC